MPGPGQKNKSKGKAKTKDNSHSNSSQPTSQKAVQCMTLDEDEITRCGNPATHGRCKIHQAQYITMCMKYKDASKVVDEISNSGKVPTQEQITRYSDVSTILEKARYARKYVEAIRVERTGRDIHSRRFFLKVDDGHKMRLKVLAKNMIRGVEAIDSLQSRAYKLHLEKNPRPDWADAVIPAADGGKVAGNPLLSSVNIVDMTSGLTLGGTDKLQRIEGSTARSSSADDEEADLIDLEIRAQKAKLLYAFEPLIDSDSFVSILANLTKIDPKSKEITQTSRLLHMILKQYALRIIFYEPNLFPKSLGKVSVKDFILSEDFSMEDAQRFAILFSKRLEIGLLWWKDSVVEAVTMSAAQSTTNAANIADPKNRIKILDGWIYNVAHQKKISDEVWFHLFKTLEPVPSNIENRFVRLCNTYDDMISFLSHGTMGLMPPPSFCRGVVAYRNHLSLCGVVITDMISSSKPPEMCMSPSRFPARRSGYRVWGQMETRAYMFGAVRNEPDSFTDSFLRELKARPDLFHFITRSETDPGQDIEAFGPLPSEEPFPAMRARNFEAPLGAGVPVTGSGEWNVLRSAKDLFYGTKLPELPGYLIHLTHRSDSAGWFFHFKKFQVKYIAIIDPIPNRHHEFLVQQVAWAALRARGYAVGEYNQQKYVAASNALFDQCAQERLGWMPAGSWSTTSMK